MLRLAALLLALLLTPAADAAATETNVNANGFPATLALPDGVRKPPAVLFIAGSGPTDRNGNNPLGVTANYLGKLAKALEAQNIASLRYDKRGLKGAPGVAREEDVTIATFMDDAAAVFDWLRQRNDLGPILVVGHSEGGLVALGLAERRPDVAGLVLLSSLGRPPADTLRDQLQAAEEPIRGKALAILAELEAGKSVAEVPPELMGLFRPSVQPFVRALLATRPAEMLAKLPQPALVVGGGSDFQVRRPDFDALATARPDVESRWFERMNHVLTDSVSIRFLNVMTYVSPDLPLTPGLADTIGAFVTKAPAR